MQNGMEKSKKEAESARKQADKYQKRMQELAPMVKDMEHMAAKFSDNPEQVLSSWEHRKRKVIPEKKAKPLMEKIVKVLRSVYASYLTFPESLISCNCLIIGLWKRQIIYLTVSMKSIQRIRN